MWLYFDDKVLKGLLLNPVWVRYGLLCLTLYVQQWTTPWAFCITQDLYYMVIDTEISQSNGNQHITMLASCTTSGRIVNLGRNICFYMNNSIIFFSVHTTWLHLTWDTNHVGCDLLAAGPWKLYQLTFYPNLTFIEWT